jgi:SnoaL-like domain
MHDFEHKLATNELLVRYFRALDEKDFTLATMESIFTSDVSIERPNGSVLHGLADILSNQRESFTRFKATQHLLVGCDVRLDDVTAHVRGNLIALHLWADGYGEPDKDENYFLAGGVVTARAEHTISGWRLSALKNDVVWRRGTGLKRILNDPLYRPETENNKKRQTAENAPDAASRQNQCRNEQRG